MVVSDAMVEAGHNAYEAKARELGHVSGSPVPWNEVPEPYRSCTVAAYNAVLGALASDPEVRDQVEATLRETTSGNYVRQADAVLSVLAGEEGRHR